MAATKDFADVIREKLNADPRLAAAVEDARFNAGIADIIFNARSQAGITQAELAALTGMKQSAIARMEDADYGRHTITSLRRIASSLRKRLEITMVDTYTAMEWPERSIATLSVDVPRWEKKSSTWRPKITTISSPGPVRQADNAVA